MYPGSVSLDDLHYVPDDVAPLISRYRIFADDIFISVAGTLGIVGRIPKKLDGANLTENADRLTGIKCDIDYLQYFLMSDTIQSEILAVQTVGAQPKLALGRIQGFEVGLPKSRSEQENISSTLKKIDKYLLAIDGLISKKRDIKQGVLQQLLTGRTRLPGFGGKWKQFKVVDLCEPSSKKAWPAKVSSETLLIEMDQIGQGTGTLLFSRSSSEATSMKSYFESGDVLFGKLRSYLRKYLLATSPGLCSTEFWVLKPKHQVTSEYLRYLVETDEFVNTASEGAGTHMPRAEWNVVKNLEFKIPPMFEQEAIGQVLLTLDKEISLLEQKLAKVKDIKQGMMQQLLTGRVRLPLDQEVKA